MLCQTVTRRSGWRYGRGCRRTALTMLKMTLVAPIPRASVMITTALKLGFLVNMRNPKRTSWINVSTTDTSSRSTASPGERKRRLSARENLCLHTGPRARVPKSRGRITHGNKGTGEVARALAAARRRCGDIRRNYLSADSIIRPIIILGVDRSGTSLIAELVHRWGAYAGEASELAPGNEGNPQGYWEYMPMEDFLSDLSRSVGLSDW